MPNRGAPSEPWITSHQSKRPILLSDRLPDFHLSQLGSSENPTYLSNLPYENKQFPDSKHPNQTPPHLDIGLRTPSPSPTSQSAAHSGSGSAELGRLQSRHSSYASDHYSLAMNQHQPNYLETQHPMSSGQQYAPHATTASSMSQYPAYPSQQSPSVMPPSHQYAQSPTQYSHQYGYGSGMTSPHGATQSIPTSMAQNLNAGLPPPLPSESSMQIAW